MIMSVFEKWPHNKIEMRFFPKMAYLNYSVYFIIVQIILLCVYVEISWGLVTLSRGYDSQNFVKHPLSISPRIRYSSLIINSNKSFRIFRSSSMNSYNENFNAEVNKKVSRFITAVDKLKCKQFRQSLTENIKVGAISFFKSIQEYNENREHYSRGEGWILCSSVLMLSIIFGVPHIVVLLIKAMAIFGIFCGLVSILVSFM